MTLRPREKALLGLLIVVAGVQGARLVTAALATGPLSLTATRKSAVRQAAERLTGEPVSELELATLCDPALLDYVERSDLRLISYHDLPSVP